MTGRAGDDMWDRRVEALAPGAGAEQVRRAALAVGWALRRDAELGGGVPALDLRREAWMRSRLAAAAGRRVAMVIGAFHAPGLTGEVAGGAGLAAAGGAAGLPEPPGLARLSGLMRLPGRTRLPGLARRR